MDGVVRRLLVAMLACVGLLAATGAWLTVGYRPDPLERSAGSRLIRLPRHGGGWVDDAHRLLAVALCVLVALYVVVLLVGAVRRRAGGWPVAGALVAGATSGAATLAGWTSGRRLPWGQLALWAVKANSSYAGVWRAAYDPVVRFILTDAEVTQPHYRAWVLVHVFAAPAVLVVAGLAGFVALRRSKPTTAVAEE